MLFVGTNDPRVPIALGWLRASQRELDPERGLPYRPFHMHDEAWPLTPGKSVELLFEVWPTCIVIPSGYRLALNIRGKEHENGLEDAKLPDAAYAVAGAEPFTHADPRDRPTKVFGGKDRLHFDLGGEPYLLPPIIRQGETRVF